MDKKPSDSNVKVSVRIRPQLARERIEMCRVCTNVTPGEPQIIIGQDKAFTFDVVLDIDATQQLVYDTCASNLIEGTFDGLNATILAYGQTGSGKTYTMGTAFDVHLDDDNESIGIIPRAVEQLFAGIEQRRNKAQNAGDPIPEFTVNAQFIELYNEELFDLLDVTRNPADKNRKSQIKIHEDARGEIYTVGITSKLVKSLPETLQCLKAGTLSRSTASTNMNTQSSRSHAIFTLLIHQQRMCCVENQPGEIEVLTAKFNFVDLAGSERLKRTGATGDRAKEGISINCGLLALGNVISALGDEDKRGCHVPYRDSKLTRLLQDSLGGNSCTTMIACISPSDCDFVETLSTLKYANRARNICNKVVVNQDSSSRQLSMMRAEIQTLQQELMDYRMGRRVADAECVNDVILENEMLKVENIGLRQRNKALQETVASLTVRNTLLVTERESMALDVVCASSDEGSENSVKQLLENYVQQIEQLKSSLIESEAVAESMRHSMTPRYTPFAVSARYSTPFAGGAATVEDVIGDDEHVQEVLEAAKRDIMKLNNLKDSFSRGASNEAEKRDEEHDGDLNETFEASDRTGFNDAGEADAGNSGLSESETENENDVQHLNEKLADLMGEISIKQKLMDELELSQKRLHAMRAQYEEKLGTLANKIKETELERDKVLSSLGGCSKNVDDASAKKVKAEYDAKLSVMQNEVKKLQAAKREHTKLLRNQTHYETKFAALKNDLISLKQLKVKLMKQLQDEAHKSRQTEQQANKAIVQLQKQQRVKDSQIKTLETERRQKEIVLRRKLEEVAVLRRQQKSGMSAKAAGRIGEYSVPVQDVQVPLSGHQSSHEVEFDMRIFRTSWCNLEKLVNSVIVKRQTLTHLDKEMERWIKQREAVGKKLEHLVKKQEKAIASTVRYEYLADLNEQIDTLRDNMAFIQDNINDCQNSIVDLEEFRDEEMQAEKIFVTTSFTEAMYLLEQCTDLAINNGLVAALKTVDCHELEAKLQQEQMENAFQRDVLNYLIQDKVDVAADNGALWQGLSNFSCDLQTGLKAIEGVKEPLDECDVDVDHLSGSVSPVDSLEDNSGVENAKVSRLPSTDNQEIPVETEVAKSSPVDTAAKELTSSNNKAVPCSQPLKQTVDSPKHLSMTPKASTSSTSKPLQIAEVSSTRAEQNTTKKSRPVPNATSSPMRRPRSAKPDPAETPPSPVRQGKNSAESATSPCEEEPLPQLIRGVISAETGLLPRGSCPLYHQHTAIGHSKAVLAVFATDTMLYSAGKDHTAKIWDLTAGVELRSLNKHPSSVVAVKFNRSNQLLYTASAYLVKVWDPRAEDCVYTLTSAGLSSEGCLLRNSDSSKPVTCPPGEINIADIAIANNCNILYTAAGNNVRIWDIRMLRSVGKLYGGHQAAVTTLAVSSSTTGGAGSCMVTGSKDRCLKIFHVPDDCTGVVNPRCTIDPSHSDGIQSLIINGSTLFSGARDMGIMKWDISETPQIKQTVANAHRDWVCGLACLPSAASSLLLSVCRAGVVKVWNAANCSLLGEQQAHLGAINAIVSCAQTQLAFTASADRTIRIWKVADDS